MSASPHCCSHQPTPYVVRFQWKVAFEAFIDKCRPLSSLYFSIIAFNLRKGITLRGITQCATFPFLFAVSLSNFFFLTMNEFLSTHVHGKNLHTSTTTTTKDYYYYYYYYNYHYY